MTQCDCCVHAEDCEEVGKDEYCEDFESSDERMLNEGE